MADAGARIVQFGTGRFLQGFLGDFVDRANRAAPASRQTHVIVVQSTGRDRADLLNRQQGRYSLLIRGRSGGEVVDTQRTLSHISRAIDAQSGWAEVVSLAQRPELEIVVSNTTERGLELDPTDSPDFPRTYPGKLAALLLARFRAGLPGLVVLPCELIEGNGALLESHVHALVSAWGGSGGFDDWLDRQCAFANTLVDRIVTDAPGGAELDAIRTIAGFGDEAAVVTEPYALWAIEGDAALGRRIGLPLANPAVRITPDIEPGRRLKVHLLNGGHSAIAAMAIRSGYRTVREAMAAPEIAQFADTLLRQEIGPMLDADPATTDAYVDSVIERWRNPFLDHQWRDIAANGCMKLRLRLVPIIEAQAERQGRTGACLVRGFASYLAFAGEAKPDAGVDPGGHEIANIKGGDAPWERATIDQILSRRDLWGADLALVPHLADDIQVALRQAGVHH